MTYVALYRKYRPATFSEVVNQEHVKRTLTNALKLDKVSHAYLFTGQRGVGKTTLARILAKAVNCTNHNKKDKPCNQCDACLEITQGRSLDIIEIDAASTRGIDEIRELREKIKFSPTKLKYRVFIIDEVHMLTTEAFNALLKTLEEPPAHAIFILCTTAPHKIPATILSRCQRFDFKKISQKDLTEHLVYIAKKEGIKIDHEALELIAAQSSGSSRDALSLLAQVIAYEDKHITSEEVKSILGMPDIKAAIDLVNFLTQGKSSEAIKLVNDINQSGYDLVQFSKNIIEYLRQILLIKVDKRLVFALDKEQFKKALFQADLLKDEQVLNLIELFSNAKRQIAFSVLPQLPLEIACIEATQKSVNNNLRLVTNSQRSKISNDGGSTDVEKKQKLVSNEAERSEAKSQRIVSNGVEVSKASNSTLDNKTQTSKTLTFQQIQQKWPEVLASVRSQNRGLDILLRWVEPQKVEEKYLILACQHKFHQERIQDHKNIIQIEKILEQIFGSKLLIKCELNQIKKQNSKLLETALEVFGGEVAE